MAATASPASHPFTIPNFRAYWLSRFTGTIAVSAMAIVIGWQVYSIARETMDIKEAAFLLGMIGFAQFVPLFLLTPITGLVADSVDRRWVVRMTTALLVATVCGVAGLVAVAIAVRHGVRHSRLSVRAIAPLKRLPKQLVP